MIDDTIELKLNFVDLPESVLPEDRRLEVAVRGVAGVIGVSGCCWAITAEEGIGGVDTYNESDTRGEEFDALEEDTDASGAMLGEAAAAI